MNSTNPASWLSNEELESRLKDFVNKEKLLLHIILDHIKEVDRRKLYLERAYSSLFEYLVKELNYSGAAAMRRQDAARLLAEIPELGQKIQKGSINLSQIGELSRAFKQRAKLNSQNIHNKSAPLSKVEKEILLAKVENKSKEETQRIISQALDLPVQVLDQVRTQKDNSVRLEVTLTRDQFDKLTKCRNHANHEMAKLGMSWPDILNYLADHYLQSKSRPATRTKTSAQVSRKKESLINSHKSIQITTQAEQKTSFQSSDKKTSVSNKGISAAEVKSRSNAGLTPKLRKQILNRDLSCQYKDPKTGRICNSTFKLEVDHKVPKWSQDYKMNENLHDPSNLQVLCAQHNRFKYLKQCHIH